jgi:hypothetical protein
MPHSKHQEQLTASCRGRRDQRLRRIKQSRTVATRSNSQLSTGKPSKASRRTARRGRFREPRRCGCGWRAAGQLDGQMLSAADREPRQSRPAAALLLQSASLGSFQAAEVTSHSRTLALASPAARQGGLRDWLPQCHGHRQRSSCSSSGRPMRPHAPVIGAQCDRMPQSSAPNATACPSHRRSRRRPPMLKEHALPQPMVAQRHCWSTKNGVRMMGGVGWGTSHACHHLSV